MNKTINITVAGMAFTLEEDAYPLLEQYLASVKRYFSTFNYGSEVYADIESRLAEQFQKELTATKVQVLSKNSIERIIKEMGTVEELSGDEKADQEEAMPSRRLYRNTDNAIIGGVASRIAAYFNSSPLIIRIIFIIAALTCCWGIGLYIILWFLVPEAKTPSEKLEMRGKATTVAELENMVKERIHSVNANGGFNKILTFFKNLIILIIRNIGKLIGLVIAIASAALIFFAAFIAANLFFNRQSPYMDQSIVGAFSSYEYQILIVLAFFVITIPLFFITRAGGALIKRRPHLNPSIALGLAALWVIATIGTSVIITRSMPRIENTVNSIQGSIQEKNYSELKDFSKIEIRGQYDATITAGKDYSVTVKGYKQDLEEVRVDVKNGSLALDHTYKNRPICFFCRRQTPAVLITLPQLDFLRLSGSSDADVSGFRADSFTAVVSGASDITVAGSYKKLSLSLSGSSNAEISGSAQALEIKASGASSIDSSDCDAQDVTIEASGATNAIVKAAQHLESNLSRASDLKYYGSPQVTVIRQSGSSNIESQEIKQE